MTLMDIINFCAENKVRNTGDIFSMRCPFHEEQTPSMAINTKNGSYHCFGCQANGDAADIQMLATLVRIRDRASARLECKVIKEEANESK